MTTNVRKKALRFIIFLGFVSLFADFTYEGARSITGPFLASFGATGAQVGIIVGFGELVGYGFRVFSGYFVDKTKQYWAITIMGYALNLFAVPLLALAGNWPVAAGLIILERFGKAIRTPAKDAMLSYATKHTGRGWGFGLHEALDQIGALLGPLTISAVLFFKAGFKTGFALLLIPAVIAMLILIATKFSYPAPEKMEPTFHPLKTKGFSSSFWIYLAAVSLVGAGFIDFALISYHFQKSKSVPELWIPIFYAISMAVGGLSSLILGKLFDRNGIAILALVTLVTAFFAPLVFLGGFITALLGMALWGIGLSSQETIMRALLAHIIPPEHRGEAYGLLFLGFGIFWFIGSALMGIFYDFSLFLLVGFSVFLQLLSLPLFLKLRQLIKIRK